MSYAKYIFLVADCMPSTIYCECIGEDRCTFCLNSASHLLGLLWEAGYTLEKRNG